MSKTNIDWADVVWNPVVGCSKVSEGCRNCYAEKMAYRLSHMLGAVGTGDNMNAWAAYSSVVGPDKKWNGQVALLPDRLEQPLHWRKPRIVFVNSMGDLFPAVPFEFIDKVFAVMALTPHLTYVVLTKRAERMKEYFGALANEERGPTVDRLVPFTQLHNTHMQYRTGGALPNLILGVSVEDQKTADERIPLLLQTPAARRVVSIEPMLGSVDVSKAYPDEYYYCSGCGHHGEGFEERECVNCGGRDENPANGNCAVCNTGSMAEICPKCSTNDYKTSETYALVHDYYPDCRPMPGLDWVICGGETGPGARPMHPDWARSLRDQCKAAGVPFFFKGGLLDGVEYNEFPEGMKR